MLRNKLYPLFKNIVTEVNISSHIRAIFTSSPKHRDVIDRKRMLRSLPAPDEGAVGETGVFVDSIIDKNIERFPNADTPFKIFNGVAFKDLPIVNVKVSPNNTILSLTDAKGSIKIIRSCGIEGFKHTKKGTNIAAQATAITMGTKVLDTGIKTIRVRVRGLGPGRMSAIKGLQMAGLEIISVTDSTRVSWNPQRPRKAKRL